jgi:hypothetical protein
MAFPFDFHSSKRMDAKDGSLRGVIDQVLVQFERQRPIMDRLNKATSVAAVWPAGPGEYYAVMLVGPAANLETLDLGLVEAAKTCVPSARKLGIE